MAVSEGPRQSRRFLRWVGIAVAALVLAEMGGGVKEGLPVPLVELVVHPVVHGAASAPGASPRSRGHAMEAE